MGHKTVKFEEYDQRVGEYWLPSDYDPGLSALVQEIATNWGDQKGFLQLGFDDATYVLVDVHHRLVGGATQELWATGEDPATARQAAVAATFPQSFQDMWMTWNRWDDYLVYAAERHIDENTDFLVAVEAYRQAPSIATQLEIYAKFVAEDAERQVNIDATTRQAIEERADGGVDVFDAAQAEIFGMLAGDFAGFLTWLGQRV
jgi:hypothetical protein